MCGLVHQSVNVALNNQVQPQTSRQRETNVAKTIAAHATEAAQPGAAAAAAHQTEALAIGLLHMMTLDTLGTPAFRHGILDRCTCGLSIQAEVCPAWTMMAIIGHGLWTG